MIFQLNGSEMADWQECWCWRCKHDHGFSHDGSMRAENGCPLVLKTIWGEDAPEFSAHGADWFRTIPAGVVCSAFELCELPECKDGPDAERRGGETRREFHDRLRAETIALPVVEVTA